MNDIVKINTGIGQNGHIDSLASDFEPFDTIKGDPACGILLICDHASNRLPSQYGALGLDRHQLDRHIGYDIGVEAVTRALAARLGIPAVLSNFSRLLIDPNRGEDDPTLIMQLSDGAVIPGNAALNAVEREERLNAYYRPYHAAIDAAIEAGMAAGRPPALFSIHSYTPVWRGQPRIWHAGILWDRDPRLAQPVIEALARDHDLVVGDNEPYVGWLHGDTMHRHGTLRGLAHALLEIRQDLIADEAGVENWVDRLQPILETVGQLPDINTVRQFGSRSDMHDGDSRRRI